MFRLGETNHPIHQSRLTHACWGSCFPTHARYGCAMDSTPSTKTCRWGTPDGAPGVVLR
jgi:hypothetical protein